VTDPIHDERLTTAGLFLETHAGLVAALEAQFARDVPGVSMHAFEVLLRLARSPGQRLRMSDLAAQVAMSPSGLTRAVDRLETAGLVERASCPSDRRGSFAVLTAAGQELVDRAIPRHLEHLDEHFTGLLDDDELRAFTAALRKLRDHVNPTAAQVTAVEPEPVA
jgi:DNA-binding MarR family transcriptional regulator